MVRIKWKFTKEEAYNMTLREFVAFMEIENGSIEGKEDDDLIYADDFM